MTKTLKWLILPESDWTDWRATNPPLPFSKHLFDFGSLPNPVSNFAWCTILRDVLFAFPGTWCWSPICLSDVPCMWTESRTINWTALRGKLWNTRLKISWSTILRWRHHMDCFPWSNKICWDYEETRKGFQQEWRVVITNNRNAPCHAPLLSNNPWTYRLSDTTLVT